MTLSQSHSILSMIFKKILRIGNTRNCEVIQRSGLFGLNLLGQRIDVSVNDQIWRFPSAFLLIALLHSSPPLSRLRDYITVAGQLKLILIFFCKTSEKPLTTFKICFFKIRNKSRKFHAAFASRVRRSQFDR